MYHRWAKLSACFLFMFSCFALGETIGVQVTVVGEDGLPIEGAVVAMSFLLVKGSNYEEVTTDKDGRVEVANTAHFGVSITAMMDGYYNSSIRTGYGDQKIRMVMREKRNPIAMYAKRTHIQPPELGVEFGYDFVIGDYVAPYGEGEISDLKIKINYEETDFFNKEYYLHVRFANPSDGLVPFYVSGKISKYKSGHLAPATGYQNQWDFRRISVAGKSDDTNFDRRRNYYFRVRTVVSEDGVIESAHYGKIYGEFPHITYYFNPSENDRNVEFEERKNLFKDLNLLERPRDP